MLNLIKHLIDREFIHQISDPSLETYLMENRTTCYAGFDPSGSSLTIGHLIPIIGLMHFQKAGHRPIAVVGGATGMIGDPSGKDEERKLLSLENLRANEAAIRKQLERFLDFGDASNSAILVNNYDWIGPFSYLEFLREIGKHFSVNAMIAKESVKKRLESRDQGISYTEFSYQILQSYDFHHLWKTYDCRVQIGGSDQWGNVTAGIDLNRRLGGSQLYGLTFPLLMTADGKKFGKSEGNALWLDENMTKPYELYQYFFQSDDISVIKYLKLFTFLTADEIRDLEKAVSTHPEQREAQKILAEQVTELVHGEKGLKSALGATQILFGNDPIQGYDDDLLSAIFKDTPSKELKRDILSPGINVLDFLVAAGKCKSKGEARRLILSGGAYINNNRLNDVNQIITLDDLASRTILILRSGKKTYHLVRFPE